MHPKSGIDADITGDITADTVALIDPTAYIIADTAAFIDTTAYLIADTTAFIDTIADITAIGRPGSGDTPLAIWLTCGLSVW